MKRVYACFDALTQKKIATFPRKKDAEEYIKNTGKKCFIMSCPMPVKFRYNCLGGKELY